MLPAACRFCVRGRGMAANGMFTIYRQTGGHAPWFGPARAVAAIADVRLRAGGAGRCRGRGSCLRSQFASVPSYAGRYGGIRDVRTGLLRGILGKGAILVPAQGTASGPAGVLHPIVGRAGLLAEPRETAEPPGGDRRWPAYADPRAGGGSNATLVRTLVTAKAGVGFDPEPATTTNRTWHGHCQAGPDRRGGRAAGNRSPPPA
jgi:hypothetical protein